MKALTAVVVVLLVGGLASGASARSWRVEKDGSGDYTTIQPALDAAAVGDTIDIGPGEYTEFQTIQPPYWTASIDIYAYVTVDDLTIIGAGADQTIIGPPVADFDWAHYGPKGIWFGLLPNSTVKDLCVQNCYGGIYSPEDQVAIAGCKFDNNQIAIALWCIDADISSCQFSGFSGTSKGIATPASGRCQNLNILDCVFFNCHVQANSVESFNIGNCTFQGGNIGVDVLSSVATIGQTTFTNLYGGAMYLANGSIGYLTEVSVIGGLLGIAIYPGSHLEARNCSISETTLEAVWCEQPLFMRLTDSDLLPASGFCVKCTESSGTIRHHDFSNNYWGVTDSSAIAALIWDGRDDSTVPDIIDFMPFEGGSTPTEAATWGAVKSLFRDEGQ